MGCYGKLYDGHHRRRRRRRRRLHHLHRHHQSELIYTLGTSLRKLPFPLQSNDVPEKIPGMVCRPQWRCRLVRSIQAVILTVFCGSGLARIEVGRCWNVARAQPEHLPSFEMAVSVR